MTYTIEEVQNDSDLRWAGRLFVRTISDLPEHAVGTLALRGQIGPDWLFLVARGADRKIIGALNSHAPYAMAEGAAQTVGPTMGQRLLNETRVLEHMAVDPDHRRQGIARDLVVQGAKSHAARGVQFWFGFLDERDDRRGTREFYEATGFQFANTARDLPDPASVVGRAINPRKGVWFWRDLQRSPLGLPQ